MKKIRYELPPPVLITLTMEGKEYEVNVIALEIGDTSGVDERSAVHYFVESYEIDSITDVESEQDLEGDAFDMMKELLEDMFDEEIRERLDQSMEPVEEEDGEDDHDDEI